MQSRQDPPIPVEVPRPRNSGDVGLGCVRGPGPGRHGRPGVSLAMELRRLLPDLRRAVGDDRAVLVGFFRGGWSPALFAHMHAEGFDVLSWRKVPAENLDPD